MLEDVIPRICGRQLRCLFLPWLELVSVFPRLRHHTVGLIAELYSQLTMPPQDFILRLNFFRPITAFTAVNAKR
ncbi:MAG: hypothetical protein P4L50_29045 [Anaerolineaceae bacterium]|nr:hypothetical protein [Anaerolineaceae bacterium]